MASSSSPSLKYDVFINFRGPDIRYGFLAHLTKELCEKQINAFVDDRLETGDEIPSALLNAIEGSMISLVVFSKYYAFSRWCLDELVKIAECKKFDKQIIVPVFYNVDPSDVKHQKGTYKDAFGQHKQKPNVSIEKLRIWRSALNRASYLAGSHHSSKFENDSDLIEAIVKDLLQKLDYIHPSETAGLVGIDQHLACIESLLKMKASAVQIIGIWGMGGIGKTTIAQAVFDKFSSQYEGRCFLENVREDSQRHGLSVLRKQLLSKLVEEKSTPKRVLIVLDDVSTTQQLQYLVNVRILMGPDSRVIVTCRDRHVLSSGGAHAIHEVQGLNFKDSLKLFCLNAFSKSHPEKGYKELSEGAVDYADGIPLALEVLGSVLFHSRNTKTRESKLWELKKYANEQIQNVLRLSYDGLKDAEKDIFRDIAFFYKGKYKDDVIGLLGGTNAVASSIIDSLLDKALITVSDNRIEMHNMIQEMGWEIVCQESKTDLVRHTHLMDNEEVYELLKDNKGTYVIEDKTLEMPPVRDVRMAASIFKKMTNLKYLKFHSFECTCLCIPTGFEPFSAKLRYLKWDEYPLQSLPLSFCPKNLVELQVRCSLVKKLWDGVQDLVNLRRLDLWGSKQLKELPDFSKAINLELVELSDCRSLCHVHPSILSLQRLVSLELWGCKNLNSLQSETPLRSLEQLDIGGCFTCEFSLSVKEVIDLRFSPFSIKIVHSSNGHLVKPTWLFFNGSTLKLHRVDELYCREVNDKPMLNIKTGDLRSLRELYLDGCSDFCYLSESIVYLSLLRVLRLKGCGIKSLPDRIKFLKMLEVLDLSDCKRLGSLPAELPKSIIHLNLNNCTSLKSVFIVTSLLHNYSLRFLSLINCVELCKYSGMKDAYLLLYHLPLRGTTLASVCYPGSIVPEWFQKNRKAWDSITIELSPNSWDLKGFVCCFVLRQFKSKQKCRIHLSCQCYFEDGEDVQGTISDTIDLTTNLGSDHVFLLYDGFCCHQILRGLLDNRRHDRGTTHSQQLLFKFSAVVNGENDDLIKECGVCPMYLSEYHSFLKQNNQLERQKVEGSSRMIQI